MKKIKYLIVPLLVTICLTGCGKNKLSTEETFKKAANNMQAMDNYKMNMSVNLGMKAQGLSVDMGINADATYDNKNGKMKMEMSMDVLGQSVKNIMYVDTKGENGKSISYSKSDTDDKWVKTESESADQDVMKVLNSIISSNTEIKQIKADKNNYNYKMTINLEALSSLMQGSGNSLPLGELDLKEIEAIVSVDKKTYNYSKITIDMKDIFEKALKTNEDVKVEISKAEVIITYSDYNKAGTVEIPSDVITEASSKTINCTLYNEDETSEVEVTTDKDDKIEKIVMSSEIEYGEDVNVDEEIATIKSMYSAYDGIDVDVDAEDGIATMTLTIDLNKVSSDTLSSLGLDGYSLTGESFKKELEEEGAICY